MFVLDACLLDDPPPLHDGVSFEAGRKRTILTILCERTNKKSSFFLFSIVVSLFYIYTKYMLNFFLRGKLLYARLCSFSTLVDARTHVCLYGRQAHHVKAGGMYDDVLNGLGVGSACRGDTRNGRLLAGFTATPRR